MKDRLAVIEERYGNQLVRACVFEGDGKRPEPLWTRKNTVDVAKGDTAMSHHVPPQAASEVKIKSDGEVDCQMSTADVCKTLCLLDDGIGQSVGVRSHEVLLGTGIALFPSSVKLVALNPPEADISVEGVIHSGGTTKAVTKTITVDIENLVPLDTKESTAKPGPLQLGYEPQMPRVPPFDFDEFTKALMTAALQTTMLELACATASMVEEQVEVVYIPEGGPEKGHGVLQCRAK